MYFGASRATSIDLCVRDLVAASRHRVTTRILAERADDIFPGFEVEHLPSPRRAATLARAHHVARAARDRATDIIIVQQHLPTAAAIARKAPDARIILHTHNFQKGYDSGSLAQWMHRVVRQRRYAHLAGLIHVSEACAARFNEIWPDVAVPSVVINNGLDVESWRPARERALQVLCVGRCAPEKGILEAARGIAAVLPKCPDWSARFILSETAVHQAYFAEVRAALQSLGARANIELQRPFAEVKAAFELAAIALVPSKWTEPFGRTALEAHAGGAALISSATGGLAEISGEAALALAEVTPEAIAAAIGTLISDEALRDRLGAAGRERVAAKFDIHVQAARLDAFCETVASASPRRHGKSEGPSS